MIIKELNLFLLWGEWGRIIKSVFGWVLKINRITIKSVLMKVFFLLLVSYTHRFFRQHFATIHLKRFGMEELGSKFITKIKFKN